MINEVTANCNFKQVRFDQRLEGAEEISHADVCGMAFWTETTTKIIGLRLECLLCYLNRQGVELKRKSERKQRA